MNAQDVKAVKAAFEYYRNHPICLEGTTTEQDEEVEDAVFMAFIDGYQYAENSTKNPDHEG